MITADLAYLYSVSNEYRSIRYDLRNMQALAAALGDPQRAFRSILIAGTNGKGSVAKLLSSMMPEAGLYTSPHLVRLNERISIGGREISDDELNEVFAAVKDAASTAKDLLYAPTYFELVTAMAFLYFRDRVKFVVLEVGLGWMRRISSRRMSRSSRALVWIISSSWERQSKPSPPKRQASSSPPNR